MAFKPGQVLWMKLPYHYNKEKHDDIHPYVIIEVTPKKLKLLQCDSTNNKKSIRKEGFATNLKVLPGEIVFNRRCVIQLDNNIEIENHPDLEKYRQTKTTLSTEMMELIKENRQELLENPEFYPMSQLKNKTYYMSKDEVIEFQKETEKPLAKEPEATKEQTPELQQTPDPKIKKPGGPSDGNPGIT